MPAHSLGVAHRVELHDRVPSVGPTSKRSARRSSTTPPEGTGALSATRVRGGGGRHRSRGRRARRCPGCALGPLRRRARHLRRQRGEAAAARWPRKRTAAGRAGHAFALSRWRPSPTGPSFGRRARWKGRRRRRAGKQRVRLRLFFVPDDRRGGSLRGDAGGEKDAVSHRGRAFRALAQQLSQALTGDDAGGALGFDSHAPCSAGANCRYPSSGNPCPVRDDLDADVVGPAR